MQMPQQLVGRHVRLEPLQQHHGPALVAAAAQDPTLYRWTVVPRTPAAALDYIRPAISARDAGTAVPFVVIRLDDGEVVGSTRFFNLERWSWPAGHPSHGRGQPDVGEIGYSWLSSSAVGTAANPEMKRLMLAFAFEDWQVRSICFHTDVRNERSRQALEGIGARFEGVLRSHRLAADITPRDSARYSILSSEWPAVKQHLDERLARYGRG